MTETKTSYELIDADEAEALAPQPRRTGPAGHEERIVWLEDPARFEYVRESVTTAATRARRPRWERDGMAGRLVGYAVLHPHAPSRGSYGPGYFKRRVWWLKAYDRDNEPGGVYRAWCPSEAVLPASVAPNRESVRVAWRGQEHGAPAPC